jgi:hypothetical protein
MPRPLPLLSSATALIVGLLAIPQVTPPLATPTDPSELLGRPASALLDALGPPDAIGGEGDTLAWVWRRGSEPAIRITVHRDLIVHVPASAGTWPEARPIPSEGAYPGQPIAELLARRGNPDEARTVPVYASPSGPAPHPGPNQQPTSTYEVLVYGEDWITYGGGRVLAVGKRPQTRAHGPR